MFRASIEPGDVLIVREEIARMSLNGDTAKSLRNILGDLFDVKEAETTENNNLEIE